MLKALAIAALVVMLVRVFVRRDSELARRFRLFVDVSLLGLALVYGGRLLQLWLQ